MKKLFLIFILLPTISFADKLIHSERLTVYECNSYDDAKLCESNCNKTDFEHEIFLTKNGNDEDYDVKNYENGKCVDCILGNNYKKVIESYIYQGVHQKTLCHSGVGFV